MAKQRKTVTHAFSGSPTLEHASMLIQEYTVKLRAMCRRIRDVRNQYYSAREKRIKQSPANQHNFNNLPPQEMQLWLEILEGFRSQHDEYVKYLRSLFPQARKLAQHVSQLITHDPQQTIVKIELSLRVAELESAIETAHTLSAVNISFHPN